MFRALFITLIDFVCLMSTIINHKHIVWSACVISIVDSIMFVHRIRKMANFELGKGIMKNFFTLVISMGPRKILSPQEESNTTPLDYGLYCSANGHLS